MRVGQLVHSFSLPIFLNKISLKTAFLSEQSISKHQRAAKDSNTGLSWIIAESSLVWSSPLPSTPAHRKPRVRKGLCTLTHRLPQVARCPLSDLGRPRLPQATASCVLGCYSGGERRWGGEDNSTGEWKARGGTESLYTPLVELKWKIQRLYSL